VFPYFQHLSELDQPSAAAACHLQAIYGAYVKQARKMDRSSLPIEVEEGLGRRSAVAEAILWEEQETEIVMFVISCLLLANYKSLQL
jgi:hypothetical protein